MRQLARDLGLAAGTVARAHQELDAAGLISTARDGGTRVRKDAPQLPAVGRRAALSRLAGAYVQECRLLGVDDGEAVDAVRAAQQR